jgi:hypothetical protein
MNCGRPYPNTESPAVGCFTVDQLGENTLANSNAASNEFEVQIWPNS